MKIKLILFSTLLMLTACESQKEDVIAEKPTEEKPQMMCPMHYDPVCAKVEIDGKVEMKTFSNSCVMGNFKGKVLSSSQGACE